MAAFDDRWNLEEVAMSVFHLQYRCPVCGSLLHQEDGKGPWELRSGDGCAGCSNWAWKQQDKQESPPPPTIQPTIPASGPPICHGEMRRSEYERPGDYLCMTCGVWLSKEDVEAGRPKAEPQQAVKPRDVALTVDGMTYQSTAGKKADWCVLAGYVGTLKLYTTREFSTEELQEIGERTPAGALYVSHKVVDQLPAGGFQFDDQGKRVPL